LNKGAAGFLIVHITPPTPSYLKRERGEKEETILFLFFLPSPFARSELGMGPKRKTF
jgi:hypothetical protein